MWNLKYILYSLLAVVFTFLIHEFSHWMMGELLGYEMRMTLNTAYPEIRKYYHDWHFQLISSVGPIISLVQAIIFYLLLKKYSNYNLYPFLFTCFYMAVLSGALSFIGKNPNDLGRIGIYLNIGSATLHIFYIIINFLLVYFISKKQHYGWKFNLITYLIITVFTSIWILTNQALKIVLL
ncbi:hypothetical protein [Marivirga harenae]|uniref:hypothetical protein n=1 Tax=Marivirga harenae TaxID=2010992 RepID=UPI0026E09901|nr:hypothetical protein [Marivirga harenae]WKV14040.1 hypothetical protein Q3Y49_09395 [Marivirga harenae]|tara:strand:+ start:351907 stop:352446 length:540 start_codon:yes stop_codon:yes gene_type:complete